MKQIIPEKQFYYVLEVKNIYTTAGVHPSNTADMGFYIFI